MATVRYTQAEAEKLGLIDRIANPDDRAHFANKIMPASGAKSQDRRRVRGTKKTVRDGLKFDSLLEADYFSSLKIKQLAGKIVHFHRQVEFILPGAVRYFCDFLVLFPDGSLEYIDTKGPKTDTYRIKKKQVEDLYDVTIIEVTREQVPRFQ